MSYDFTNFKNKVADIENWASKEMMVIRTGQATVTLLDSVRVDVYGSKKPLNQNSSISIEGPKTIKVTPWDKSIIKDIEKGIILADLGVSTTVDGDGVRVIFPDLTTETRERLIKQAKNKIEEAKVSIRNERGKVSNEIQSEQRSGELSEDEAKRDKISMQKIVDDAIDRLDTLLQNKEKEIMS